MADSPSSSSDISDLILTRTSERDGGTWGVLEGKNQAGKLEFLALTLELPWRENKKKISCIPPGTYPIRRHHSPRFGVCVAIDNVPGRSAIRIHAGNLPRHSTGCVLPGLTTGILSGEAALQYSQPALNRILRRFTGNGTIVVIRGTSQ